MAYSRPSLVLLSGRPLTDALRGCGLRLGRATPAEHPDIELTLASAARAALPSDYRLLGVLTQWLGTHRARVNVPRLGRIVRQSDPSEREAAWWSAVARWLGVGDSRWRSLGRLYTGPALALEGDPVIAEMMVARHGPDPRFDGSPLLVHAKLLRSRAADVASPEELIVQHAGYRSRLLHGPNYRADVWAELDRDAERPITEVARAVGCAYETARSVAEDWRLFAKAAEEGFVHACGYAASRLDLATRPPPAHR